MNYHTHLMESDDTAKVEHACLGGAFCGCVVLVVVRYRYRWWGRCRPLRCAVSIRKEESKRIASECTYFVWMYLMLLSMCADLRYVVSYSMIKWWISTRNRVTLIEGVILKLMILHILVLWKKHLLRSEAQNMTLQNGKVPWRKYVGEDYTPAASTGILPYRDSGIIPISRLWVKP